VVLSLGGLSQDKLPENQAISLPLDFFRFGIEQALDLFFSSGYEMVYTNITKKE